MDPVERAALLRREADLVLQAIGLGGILAPHGGAIFTGSYFLDVMVYPDIDLMLAGVTLEGLFQIAGTLAAQELVRQIVFERSDDPELPGGLYLKARAAYGDWGRPWKIDMWSLDRELVAARMRDMARLKAKMTPPLRERIIRYKASILTRALRTPMYSGYQIYKAILDEGLSEPEQVTRYLAEHGINLSQE